MYIIRKQLENQNIHIYKIIIKEYLYTILKYTLYKIISN